MTEAVETLKTWVQEAKAIAFFGGAGVSTESGIPDFRSTGGLYHQEWKYPPETILSHTFYKSNPEEFFRFYRAKMLAPEARPNAAHKKLAELEDVKAKNTIKITIRKSQKAEGKQNRSQTDCLRQGKEKAGRSGKQTGSAGRKRHRQHRRRVRQAV